MCECAFCLGIWLKSIVGVFSVFFCTFRPFFFWRFFAKRGSGGWAKWRLALPWSCNPPHRGLRVISYFFSICMCKLCFLHLLLVFVMKCVYLHSSLPRNPYFFLNLFACFTCSSSYASTLHPLLAHHYLCYVDVYCIYFIFAVFLCFFSLCVCFILAFVTFDVCVVT